jgi:outer membrane protein OmpA-like peptidoglycan-associated protein
MCKKYVSMNLKTLATVVAFGTVGVTFAQRSHIELARKSFRGQEFCEATSKCETAYGKIARKSPAALKQKGEMAFKAGESYRFTENPKLASEWYEKAIILKYQKVEPEVFLHNAEMYLIVGDDEKAKKNFNDFLALVPGDQRGENGLASIKQKATAKMTRYTVTNEKKINTGGWEMAPNFGDRKQTQMTFSQTKDVDPKKPTKDTRTCEPYFDLWVTELDKKGNWQAPTPVLGEGINTEDNEGTVAFSNRGKKMFFTRCPNEKKHNLGCDIWVTEMKGKEWGAPSKIVLKTADSLSVGHPCVTEDGKMMIFASDIPGGFGGKDLWYTTYDRKSDSWSAPVNMGPGINTPGDELFPSFSLDDDLIYASNGLPGYGGLDIFKAKKVSDTKWENPVNFGMPINSKWNDYALYEYNKRSGYFTSERQGNVTEYKGDIWKYELPPFIYDLTVVVGEVGDKTKTKRVAGVPVTVTMENGQKFTGTTNAQGKVFWDKKPDGTRFVNEEESYTISLGNVKGYKENTKTSGITTKGVDQDQNFFVEMQLVPDRTFVLPEVRYPLDKWDLLVDGTINSRDSLNFVYDLLTEYPGMVLELNSHTDARGSDNHNKYLSDNRAKECYKYLIEKGIDPRRIVPIGRGESVPQTIIVDGKEVKLTEAYINQFKKTNKAEFERLHQLNRRTDARVLSMEFDPATAPPANPNYLKFTVPLPK